MTYVGDAHHLRVSRELFLATFGAHLGRFESWVGDRVSSMLEEEDVPAREVLYSIGEAPEFFYFVRNGKLRLERDGRPARVLAGRHVFGLLDGLLEQPRSQTAIAVGDLEVMRVRIDRWLELLDDSFELSRALVLELARSVVTLEERLEASGGTRPAAARQVAPQDTRHPVFERPFGIVERLAFLTEVPLFRRGGIQPLSDLAAGSREAILKPGEPLFESGVLRDRICVVVDGEVEATRDAGAWVRTARPGDIVCGAAALGEWGSPWRACAATVARVLSFRRDDWFDLMEEHFDMVRSALAGLSLERETLLDALSCNGS